jgi:hypothetical protein
MEEKNKTIEVNTNPTINKFNIDSTPKFVLIISCVIWLVSSVIDDIYTVWTNGFIENKFILVPFTFFITSLTWVLGRHKYISYKATKANGGKDSKKTETCTKCGKSKSK